MSIDIPALRALLAAEQHADLVMQANPGNGDALARACNLTGSLVEAAVNALPELLAIAEAAGGLYGWAAHRGPASKERINHELNLFVSAVDAARSKT